MDIYNALFKKMFSITENSVYLLILCKLEGFSQSYCIIKLSSLGKRIADGDNEHLPKDAAVGPPPRKDAAVGCPPRPPPQWRSFCGD